MEKLPLSIGILAWHSGQTLIDTLYSYYKNNLLNLSNDITIFFQEITDEDKKIANHFQIPFIGNEKNIGIGKAFLALSKNAQTENILLLEHDWFLIENPNITQHRLTSGINLLNQGFNVIKYRHRLNPGFPLFTYNAYKDKELNHLDSEIQLFSPHLLESIHWLDPAEKFPDKIQKQGEYYVTNSRWGNWTNNPCLFKTKFYTETVTPFAGDKIDLEGKISYWWVRQDFKVAHGEGLFTHKDIKKYGK